MMDTTDLTWIVNRKPCLHPVDDDGRTLQWVKFPMTEEEEQGIGITHEVFWGFGDDIPESFEGEDGE